MLLLLGAGTALRAQRRQGGSSAFASNTGLQLIPFMYLGAKPIWSPGYDHLLFLVGVIFFLYRLEQVALYATLFAIGHSVTLLSGVLGHIDVNPYVIDAIIGLSVVYKAFDTMNGFKTLFGVQPEPRIAVLVFGLVHGFGLATSAGLTAVRRRARREHHCVQRRRRDRPVPGARRDPARE